MGGLRDMKKQLQWVWVAEGSLKRTMGKPLTDKNKRAYFGPEGLPGRPDGGSAGHLQRRAFFTTETQSSQSKSQLWI